ncbi:MAG: hypothetical protein WDZ51_08365 [Pirellulaceae bacterium]
MNEHAVSSLLESGFPPLERAIADLRGHNEHLEEFIEQLLGEISNLTDQFENQAQALARHGCVSEEESARRDALVAENQRLLALVESRDQEIVSRDQAIVERDAELARLRQSALQASAAPENDVAEQMRQQVESLRQELASTKIELLKKNKQINPAVVEHSNLNQLKRQNEELEGELHRVRGRAAQLTDTLDRRERELKQQQQAWAGEMQAMRETLGNRGSGQSRGQAASDTSVASAATTVVRDEMESRSSGNNAVVDSVLAQFAKIQRDVSRRRAQQKSH